MTYPTSPGFKGTDTSRAAAEHAAKDAHTIRGECLRAFEVFGPMTADEVADRLNLSVLTIRPRITELKKMGKIQDTLQRRNNTSGRSAAVMNVTRTGKLQQQELFHG